MKLDRNINGDGKGKYALIRLRPLYAEQADADSESVRSPTAGDRARKVWAAIRTLERAGILDWGVVGQPDEFFVIKLRDKYAAAAIKAYADAAMDDSARETLPDRAKDKAQWALQVQAMSERAGDLNPFCKEPD